jgi:glyoxylase-like metal-dependent hydrolase (beta-lactamase superfamily II)
MTIEIHSLTLGIAATNAYIIGDTDSGDAVLIDPVDDAFLLLQTIVDLGWDLKLILTTHGHYDHVLASLALRELSDAPFYIHHRAGQFQDALSVQPALAQLFPPIAPPTRLLTDASESITIGGIKLETFFTPGHAPGHVCYLLRDENLLIGGDCLFAGSIGRTDLPFCDYDRLMESIFEQILPLGDEVQILPGHMGPTTIGEERRSNPFLLQEAARRSGR